MTDDRDRYSVWSIVLIVLIVLSQIVLNNGEGIIKKAFHVRHASASDSVSTDSFEQLITIDNEVKFAYFESWLPASLMPTLTAESSLKSRFGTRSGLILSSFHQGIEKALNDSTDALRGSPDSVYFARRVMILRGLLVIPPLSSISGHGKKKGFTSPLNAYELAAKENPDIAASIRKEEAFWRLNFSSATIPHDQIAARLAQLNQYPTLLFYGLIARQELCLKAGSFVEAKRINLLLQHKALSSISSLAFLVMLVGVLFLIGVLVWFGFLTTTLNTWVEKAHPTDSNEISTPQSNAQPVPGAGFFDRFIYPRPELIANIDRKLRAGDLLNCFAIYLLCLTGIGTALGLSLQLIPHSEIKKLGQLDLIYLNIGFALLSYLGASLVALLFLIYRANKVGASLADELGLSKRFAARNIIYGAMGWGTALVLLLVVSSLSADLFHSLPAPENPALPMLSFAPNTISRFALYGLAAIAAPFFEETFFRGVLLNSLLLRFKPGIACLIVGLMFGAIHPVGVAEALSLAALGTVFAWMAYLRKSLVPSMFAHFMQNSYAYFTVYLSFAILLRH